MKAKDLLKEIVKYYPDVVAIAQDSTGISYAYYFYIPVIGNHVWLNSSSMIPLHKKKDLEWDSENWKENIVTIIVKVRHPRMEKISIVCIAGKSFIATFTYS